MLYRVLLDGEDILDFSDPELVLLSPQVDVEIDTTGSFEFSVPPNHKYYDRFEMDNIMAMTIEVYEDEAQHFFGRPIEIHLDFHKNKKVYCEGAFGYFNDSVQREKEYPEGTYLSDFFIDVVSRHNEMVEESRRFQVDQMSVPDHEIYRKVGYEQTSDVLKSKLLDAEEGHFFLERRDGVNYISFLRDDTMPYECNQTVEFAKNLLNFTYSFDGKDFATCVLPLGATISESDGGTGKPLTIASVNGGSDILVGNSAVNYGRIIKTENYSDIRTPEELLAEAQKYLTKLQYNAMIIECSAVDLHATDYEKTPFRVGQMVHCISDPHGIDTYLPLSKITLYLDSAAKQITLGRIPKKTLSRFYKEETASAGRTGGVGSGTTPDVDPWWYIVYPEDSGGTPTMNKSPVRMKISHMPTKTEYDDGETIDFTGMECTLLSSYSTAAEEVIFSDERYPGGIIPFGELIFSPTVMPTNPKISDAQFVVKWKNPYKKNSTFACSFVLVNKTKAAEEAAAIAQHGSAYPTYIEVSNKDSQQYQSYIRATHKNGEMLKIPSGWVVKAYYPDGSPYDKNGYTDGVIPHSELILSPKVADKSKAEHEEYSDGDGINAMTVSYTVSLGNNEYCSSRPLGTITDKTYGPYMTYPVTLGGYHGPATILLTKYFDTNYNKYVLYAKRISGSNSNVNLYAYANGKWIFRGWTSAYTVTNMFMSIVWDEYIKDVPISTKKPYMQDVQEDSAIQKITIMWARPGDKQTLSTSFEIKIK